MRDSKIYKEKALGRKLAPDLEKGNTPNGREFIDEMKRFREEEAQKKIEGTLAADIENLNEAWKNLKKEVQLVLLLTLKSIFKKLRSLIN